MKIIIVIILSIFLYPAFTTQDNPVVEKQAICNIVGSNFQSTYVFDINKLPERCDIIMVGLYVFGSPISESDKGVITTLIAANKPVYTYIGSFDAEKWELVFNPPNAEEFQKTIFDPLIEFLNTIKVNGIIISCSELYDYVNIENFAQKMSNFVCAIKAKVDNLKVGLIINGALYESFPDNTKFDFSITNSVLDLYIIDLSELHKCDMSKAVMSPITSTDPNVKTVEKVTCAVTSSKMEKSKIYALVQAYPLVPNGQDSLLTTYSLFCATDQTDKSTWCTVPSQLLYDQGVHVKKFYAGILADALDTDDYESKCECGPFPVINLILDGWTGSPFKDCPKLDCN